MKTAQSLTSFFILVFFLLSCTEGLEQQSACVSETKNPCSYNISISEISRIDFSHIFSSNPKTKSGNQTKEILPVVQEADTLLYVINYGSEDGWIIASSDKRTPVIMAMSECGHFVLDKARQNKGFALWLDRVEEDISYLKQNPSFVPDSTLIKNWETIDGIIETKGGIEHEGEWLQLVYTMMDTYVEYNIDHLLSTRWGQDAPWNQCLPYETSELTNRCSAGCSVVAGAQVAYFLHYKIGKPTQAYQYGVCVDSCHHHPFPIIWLFNESSSNWATMVTDSTNVSTSGRMAVSALMGDVGQRSHAQWDTGGTSVSLSGLMDYFGHYSISCSSSNFNDATVVNQILAGYPVIVGMTPINSQLLGLHTAVIDGVKVITYRYIYYYQWMPIGTFPPIEPEYPDLEHPELYEIGTNDISSIYYYRINWGFDGMLDDALYYYTDSWGIQLFKYYPDTILYNFH